MYHTFMCLFTCIKINVGLREDVVVLWRHSLVGKAERKAVNPGQRLVFNRDSPVVKLVKV